MNSEFVWISPMCTVTEWIWIGGEYKLSIHCYECKSRFMDRHYEIPIPGCIVRRILCSRCIYLYTFIISRDELRHNWNERWDKITYRISRVPERMTMSKIWIVDNLVYTPCIVLRNGDITVNPVPFTVRSVLWIQLIIIMRWLSRMTIQVSLSYVEHSETTIPFTVHTVSSRWIPVKNILNNTPAHYVFRGDFLDLI